MNTRSLIEECRDALAEELAGWDLTPPLHHVKQAHDRCVAWLALPAEPAQGAAPAEVMAEVVDIADGLGTTMWMKTEAGERLPARSLLYAAAPTREAGSVPAPAKLYCPERLKPSGCQLPNVHCGWPDCNKPPTNTQSTASEASGEVAK